MPGWLSQIRRSHGRSCLHRTELELTTRVGKAYAIGEVITATYFYPRGQPRGPEQCLRGQADNRRSRWDARREESCTAAPERGRVDGMGASVGSESDSWSGYGLADKGQTPATCANIGLHNLYPGEIDFVISGPNRGYPRIRSDAAGGC